MAITKTTTAKASNKKKVEAKPVEVKKTEATAKVTAPKAAETKTAAPKVAAKPAVKVAAPKKATTKTSVATKTVAKKETALFIEFNGNQTDIEVIKANAVADYKAKSGKKSSPKSVKIYIKPEDSKAYYVIDDVFGNIAL